jgi:hypothetical protein
VSEHGARLLEHWHEFYLLVGTAAAALVALLFVAASIGAGYMSAELRSGTRTFMSPVVFHFTAVLFISMVALVPSHSPASLAVLVAASALVAGGYAIVILVRVIRNDTIDRVDKFFYGVTPLIGHALALAAAWLILRGSPHGPNALAAAVIFLLTLNVRNAWDLMLFFSGKHREMT